MKRFLIFILIIIVIGVTLVVLNPTKDDFKVYIESKYDDEINMEENPLTTALYLLEGKLIDSAWNGIVNRDEHYIFSIYSFEDEYYIGFLKRIFIELDKNAKIITGER